MSSNLWTLLGVILLVPPLLFMRWREGCVRKRQILMQMLSYPILVGMTCLGLFIKEISFNLPLDPLWKGKVLRLNAPVSPRVEEDAFLRQCKGMIF